MAKFESTAQSLAEFSKAAGDIQKLTKSLSKAAAITEAIENLPNAVRETLEEVNRQHIADAKKSRGWFGRS